MAEYPQTPEVPSGSGIVNAEQFSDAVAEGSIAASREEVTPVADSGHGFQQAQGAFFRSHRQI